MSSAVETTSPRSGEAGHWGNEVRSDAHVVFEARDRGGVEISLESRVAPYYGSAILEQTREVLGELGVKHARVAIHDEGALPFVIAARIEAAARRAGIALGKRSLPEQHPLPAPSQKDRLRRSRLYLPGSEPKYYINASLHAADAVILDLEDSVHRGEKDAARILVRNTLRAVDFGSCERMVRINQLPLGLEDLAELVGESPDLILIPKVEEPEQVREVDRMIALTKKSGPATEKERREWLKKEHKLGSNSAAWIAERLDGKGTEEDSPEAYLKTAAEWVEAQYAGPRAALRPLYEQLLKLGFSLGKDVKACPCKTMVPFYRNRVFAQIKPSTNTRIDLGFALGNMKTPRRLIDTGGYAKKDRITRRIEVRSKDDIDDELKRWLKKAYEMDE